MIKLNGGNMIEFFYISYIFDNENGLLSNETFKIIFLGNFFLTIELLSKNKFRS